MAEVAGDGGRGGRSAQLWFLDVAAEVAGATAGQFLAVAAWVDGAAGGGV